MENYIDSHKQVFLELEQKANQGVKEITEFAKVLENKMDCERACARSNKKFSTFKFQHLYDSQYGKIFEEMVNCAESKSRQSYDLIKNISQDIYDPLQECADSHYHAITGISYDGRKAMKVTKDLEDDLQTIKAEYYSSKVEMKRAISNYEKFCKENKGDDKDTVFYRDKLFGQMNSKMRVSHEKENAYQLLVKRANDNLKFYTERMQGLVRVYSQMEKERKQLMIDSLNKLVIFETSVEMTLKYDAKMFVKLIEEITQPEKEPNDKAPKEETKLDETTMNETKDSPAKSDTQSALDEEYCEYISKFDQFGEYKFVEAEDEESEVPVIHDPVKSKYEEEIFSLVQSLVSEDAIKEPLTQMEMDNFISIMEQKLGRTVLLDYLKAWSGQNSPRINSRLCFEQLSRLIIGCFDRILTHDDRESGLKLIEICNNIFYQQDPSKEIIDTSQPLRKYLSSCIENLGPVKKIGFWEKMAFESIRRELKNEFFEYDYEADTENAFREIIFYKLSSLLTMMLSFGVSKDDTKKLVVKFCESHELRQDQRIHLISRIANYETYEEKAARQVLEETEKDQERDENGLKKARKGIPDWLQQIEAIQAPRYEDTKEKENYFGFMNRKETPTTEETKDKPESPEILNKENNVQETPKETVPDKEEISKDESEETRPPPDESG
ncbi:unnamed protein product [Moneuplotes crassus]|uniref:Uncharacterized protein n=1 Tax=Euplotes crassus TaxID=5936 RepID=A0AAD2DCL2_EUPCR|nr:unnamed protein product [Moneuplotes crassus]